MPTTLRDVARLAGVHPSIASRVLNGDKSASVREETRRRVTEAASELAYRPNGLARGLRTKLSGCITLVVPDLSNPAYAEILRGAEREARKNQYFMLLASQDSNPREKRFLRAALESRVDGVLLANAKVEDHVIEELDRDRFPYVLVNRRSHKASRYVVGDDYGAAKMAVGHLLEQGHRRIGHLAGPETADTAHERQRGYLDALREAEITPDPQLVVAGDYAVSAGRAGLHTLMHTSEPPTAVFAVSFQVAVGALEAAHELKLEVPRDLSIVNIDEFELAAAIPPGLTTVRMPLAEMGEAAVRMLLGVVRGSEPGGQMVLPRLDLVRRNSVGPPLA